MRPLSHYFASCRELTAERFAEAHTGPFLVHFSTSGGALKLMSGGRTLDGLVVDEEPESESAERVTVFTANPSVRRALGLTVGSGRDCSLRVAVASVSRTHAKLRHEGDAWFIEDAGSSTGTWVNGVAVDHARHRLSPGDRVSIGVLDFTFLPSTSFHAFVTRAMR